MRPVSAALLSTVRGSHHMAARARIVTSFQTGTDPDGTEIPIIGGDVELDASADVRSTLDLTSDPALWPAKAADLVTPYGNEVFVERGVQLGGGATEWVGLGYFRIRAVDQDNAPKGAVRIAAQDRMRGIVRGRLTSPRQFTASTSYGTVVEDLVTDIYPQATVEWDDGTRDRLLGRAVICEEDRFAFLNDLVQSVGKVWYWDHRGVLLVKSPPDPAVSVFDVTSGAGGVLVTLNRNLSDDEVYNGVVASGQAPDSNLPARAVVIDVNPLSPTRWGGPFGKVPKFYSSPLLTDDAQCAAAAASMLITASALPYNVDFTAVPNPALEPLDPVRVSDPGRVTIHVLDKLKIPLVADAALTSAAREQPFLVVGTGV